MTSLPLTWRERHARTATMSHWLMASLVGGVGAAAVTSVSIVAAGYQEWDDKTWLGLIGGVVAILLAAWGKIDSWRARRMANSADETAKSAKRKANRNSKRIDKVDDRVHDVAKAVQPSGDPPVWFRPPEPPAPDDGNQGQ